MMRLLTDRIRGVNRLTPYSKSGLFSRSRLFVLATLIPGFFLLACSEQPQESVAEAPDKSTTAAPQAAPAVEKGLFFQPELTGFALHNEYDDDGDGDGVNETHVRRYINSKGDSAFSMTTGDRLWAWSLNSKDGDDTDIRNNHVVRDSNCDGVFDERYSLDAEFRVPACLAQEEANKTPEGV